MRRAREDYEDKAMSSKPPREPDGPAPAGESPPAPVGPPVDVRPSERELAEAAEEGKPRPSEKEAAEEAARRAKEQQEAASEGSGGVKAP